MSSGVRFLADEAATLAWGRELAGSLTAGTVIALDGELGAGKTTLVRGLVAGLGSGAAVSSPTFALVQEYPGGRLIVSHLDWYRLETEAELWALGWEELLETPGVVVVEWASRFPEALPPETRFWQLRHARGGGREFVEG